MTTDDVCAAIKGLVEQQANQEGGPDPDNTLRLVLPYVEEPALALVLRTKGKLVIEIIPPPVILDNEQLADQMAQIRHRAGVSGGPQL